jgi:hypothetical protein
MTTNNVIIKRRLTKGCPQGSCCGPGFWNVLYNSLLNLDLTSHSKAIAFADNLMILISRETVIEAENYMNLEVRKILEWAINNKPKFTENKSKVMLMSCRRRREKKEREIYVNNKILKQFNSLKYLEIIFDSKLTLRGHVKYTEEKCSKLIFLLSRSAKITWGLKHEAMKTIYTGGILPLLLYGARLEKCVEQVLLQSLINLRIANSYRRVSNEALCVINGIIPINIKTEETGKFYQIRKGIGTQYDREMEMESWNHPATHVKIIEEYEDSSHPIQAYTDGSKNDLGVGAGIAIFLDSNLTATLK